MGAWCNYATDLGGVRTALLLSMAFGAASVRQTWALRDELNKDD